jgi:hypothetical protein
MQGFGVELETGFGKMMARGKLLTLVDAVDAVVKQIEMNGEEDIGGRAIKGWVVGGDGSEMMVGSGATVVRSL